MRVRVLIATALVVAMGATPALAQKAKDTLRTAFSNPIETIDLYLEPGPENALLTRTISDGLVFFDEAKGEFRPLLATAWRQPDPLVYEFDLRTDVTWHDGQPFKADDVVYTINWLIDPKSKYRNPADFAWIERVEKLSAERIRITAKEPFAPALVRAAYSLLIYPEHVHGKLAEKSDFGRAPVGTGPYKLTQVDKNKGILAERVDRFAHGGDYKVKSNINRWHILPLGDSGTQTAQMMVGGLDYVRGIDLDQAKDLAKAINGRTTSAYGLNYTYALFDTRGRAGAEALRDERVRRAVLMAIDRKAIVALYGAAGEAPPPVNGLCFKVHQGCGYTADLLPYDPAAARKLLAEAGHANGFDLEITTYVGLVADVAKVVAGQLRQVGINASIDAKTLATARKKLMDGKIQMLVGGWSQGGLPDPQGTVRQFVRPTGDPDDSFGDDELVALAGEVNRIVDDTKRRAQVARVLDRLTERSYVVPIVSSPTVFVHSDDVVIARGSLNPYGTDMKNIRWK